MDDEPRCLSACKITAVDMKRCVRARSHAEEHLWVAATGADGTAMVVRWAGAELSSPSEVLTAS